MRKIVVILVCIILLAGCTVNTTNTTNNARISKNDAISYCRAAYTALSAASATISITKITTQTNKMDYTALFESDDEFENKVATLLGAEFRGYISWQSENGDIVMVVWYESDKENAGCISFDPYLNAGAFSTRSPFTYYGRYSR